MLGFTLKKNPENLYRRHNELAKSHRRSLGKELVVALEKKKIVSWGCSDSVPAFMIAHRPSPPFPVPYRKNAKGFPLLSPVSFWRLGQKFPPLRTFTGDSIFFAPGASLQICHIE